MKRWLARQRFIQTEGRAIDVTTLVVATAAQALGRDVAGRAGDEAAVGELGGAAVVEDTVTEVEELHELAASQRREEHVGRLEIAVEHARAVHRIERIEQLRGDGAHGVDRERALRLDALRERASLEDLHDEKGLVALGAYVGHAHDVRVLEPRHELDLAHHPRDRDRVGRERPPQELHRDLGAHAIVVRCVHHAAASARDHASETIASGQQFVVRARRAVHSFGARKDEATMQDCLLLEGGPS